MVLLFYSSSVVRFTREELIEIRANQSSSKVLSVMSGMLEVLSLERQEPACLEKFDQDDVRYLSS